jgi:hypothetical protein
VLALQNLDEPLSLRVFILVDSEFLGGWHILINFKGSRVKIVPGYHLNLANVLGDLISDLVVLDVLSHQYQGLPIEGGVRHQHHIYLMPR